MPNTLFAPMTLGDLTLPNRIVMAPLTRNRAEHGTDAPHALNAEYYRQRATAGLIISEATQISREGQGYAWTPGMYTAAQLAGWQGVTKAVHGAGGRIFAQLWHVGRLSHTALQEGGAAPVAPSAIQAKSKVFIETGLADTSMPRALEISEITRVAADFAAAARMAGQAGFDGIELHAANGYLIDQFLKDGTNTRTDQYGGSIENRARFGLEAVDAILAVHPADRLGIRISPAPVQDAADSHPQALFGYFVEQLGRRGLAYVHVVEGTTGGDRAAGGLDYAALQRAFPGAWMVNNGYTRGTALDAVAAGRADLVAFGKPFIANPDLEERLRQDAPLNEPVQATFYGGGAEGYTDYPALPKSA